MLQKLLHVENSVGSPDGLMNLSYLGGFRVNPWPTNVTLVTIRFQLFFFLLPDFSTLNISSSATGRTCSRMQFKMQSAMLAASSAASYFKFSTCSANT